MSILRLFSSRPAPVPDAAPPTAPIARERLQILLAHERGMRGQPDLLMQLREEILAVVSKHVVLDPDKVIVRMERGKNVSTLEVDIELPSGIEKKFAATG
jgi:cell division topological specificity factor